MMSTLPHFKFADLCPFIIHLTIFEHTILGMLRYEYITSTKWDKDWHDETSQFNAIVDNTYKWSKYKIKFNSGKLWCK